MPRKKELHYEDYLKAIRARPITIIGAEPNEVATIRSALNLLRTRAAEKHIAYPNMGWDAQANLAEELEIRIQ